MSELIQPNMPASQPSPVEEQAWPGWVEKDWGSLNARLDEKETHTKLLAEFYLKLNKKQDVTIVCQGDSMTYGQDTVSADKRTASGSTDSGSAHGQTKAGVTYPEALQTYLRDIYNNTSTVINKGYSGDWAEASYGHWDMDSGADIAFVMIGTNDSNLGASWVPSDVKGNIGKYLTDMRKVIRRYIGWNTAVILLTPPKLRTTEDPTTTNSHNTEPFRHALMILGDEFGCPVIDTESFLNGCDATYYSDTVHLNTKGYTYFASRLASVLIGYGAKNPIKIRSGDTLSVRRTRDNVVTNNVVLSYATTAGGAEESTDGQGLVATLDASSEIFYGFETLEDNLILIPIYYASGGSAMKAELDFGNEQGSIPILAGANRDTPQGFKPLSTIQSTTPTNGSKSYDGSITPETTDQYLWITNKGWHNIKLSNGTGIGSVSTNGFIVISFKDFNDIHQEVFNTYSFQTQELSDSTSVTSTIINMQTVADTLGLILSANEYWKNPPLRISVFNWGENLLDYTVHCGGLTANGDKWMLGLEVRETKFKETPVTGNLRTLASISYNTSTKDLTLNWAGATTRATAVTIQAM